MGFGGTASDSNKTFRHTYSISVPKLGKEKKRESKEGVRKAEKKREVRVKER